jgi:hypothetical protein
MTVYQAIDLLVKKPSEFLTTETLVIAGGGASATAGPARFKMAHSGGTAWRATFVSNSLMGISTDEFVGWYIPMQQLPGFTANSLPTPDQSPIGFAITSQMSGCIFGIGQSGTQTIVAHIQPNASAHTSLSAPDRSPARQSDLRGGLATAGLSEAFGSGGSYNHKKENVAVVGQRAATGKWTFWAQNYDGLRQISGLSHTM